MNILSIDMGGSYLKCAVIDTKSLNTLEQSNYLLALKSSLDQNGNIPEDKIIETIKILNDFKKLGKKYNCTQIKGAATGGVRQSNNSQQFLDRIYKETGIQIKLISGVDEANYTYKGILLSFKNDNKYNKFVTIDIGSSSTEISYGNKESIIKSNSVDTGSVNLTLKFNIDDRETFNEDDINGINYYLNSIFNKIQIPPYSADTAYVVTGSSGYVPLLFANPQFNGDDKNIKQKSIWIVTIDMVKNVINQFMTEKKDNNFLTALHGAQPDKEFCNAVILKYILEKLNIADIFFSTVGLRHGLILSENISFIFYKNRTL